MKLLVVFVHDEDVESVANALRSAEFRFTMVHGTSGFLQEPSTTFLLGVAEARREACLEIFREKCDGRVVGAPGSFLDGQRIEEGRYRGKYEPAAVEVGGAVAFSIDAERVL